MKLFQYPTDEKFSRSRIWHLLIQVGRAEERAHHNACPVCAENDYSIQETYSFSATPLPVPPVTLDD